MTHADINTPQKKYDVVIVGGGMAGTSLALLLAHNIPSLQIALIESLVIKSDQTPSLPSYDDRSSALSLGSCRIFQPLDIWNKLLPHLTPIRQVHVSDRGHPAGTLLNSSQMNIAGDVLGYVVENRQLGSALFDSLDRTKTVTILSQTRVKNVKPGINNVSIEIDCSIPATTNTTSIEAALLVIADGAESALREQLGIAVDRIPYGQAAVIANVTTSSFHDYIAYERFTDSGPMALLPLQDFNGEHRCALVWTIDAKESSSIESMDDVDFLQQIQQRFGQRLGFFTKTGKRAIYPLSLHKAREQIRSNIVLMGNSAHAMHPVAGQGFNLTLRDAMALTETLATAIPLGKTIGSLSVLNDYISHQTWDQEKTISASHVLTLLFSNAESTSALARNTGLLGLNFLPGIKNWFTRHAMGIAGK